MKRIACIAILLGMISCLTLGQNRDVSSLPFPVDPNKIVGDLLGSYHHYVGIQGSGEGDFKDDENDPMTAKCISGLPAGMTYAQVDGTHWRVSGTPTVVGTYYIVMEVGDAEHPVGTFLSTKGTVVWFVVKRNNTPVLNGCGSSSVR